MTAPVKRSEIPDPNPGYCSCESAYCGHHGGNMATPDAKLALAAEGGSPECGPCTNVPEGHFTMDWLGVVCDACAKANPSACHEVVEG